MSSSAAFSLQKEQNPHLQLLFIPKPATNMNNTHFATGYSESGESVQDCRCWKGWGETAVVAILLLLSSPSARAAFLHNWWLSAECEGVSGSAPSRRNPKGHSGLQLMQNPTVRPIIPISRHTVSFFLSQTKWICEFSAGISYFWAFSFRAGNCMTDAERK